MAHNDNHHTAGSERRVGVERMSVWPIALGAMASCDEIAGQLPRPYGEMADQLRRASLSFVCNLAEGVGRDGADQVRFFRMARGSTYESAALIEAANRRGSSAPSCMQPPGSSCSPLRRSSPGTSCGDRKGRHRMIPVPALAASAAEPGEAGAEAEEGVAERRVLGFV
jgi:four helix bundle protein